MTIDLKKLAEPFDAWDIEWRIGQSGVNKDGPWAKALAYITNRAIMNRLDEVCGPEAWHNDFKPWVIGEDKGVLCGISVKLDGEWVTKWDGAGTTDIEPIKGGFSDSMKRAGVQWGIGRYLYNLEATFVDCMTERPKDRTCWNYASCKTKEGAKVDFYWKIPELKAAFLPKAAEPKANTSHKEPAKDADAVGDEAEQLAIFNEHSLAMQRQESTDGTQEVCDRAGRKGLNKYWMGKLFKLRDGRNAIIAPNPEKKKRTPAQLVADFKANVALFGMNLKTLMEYRAWLSEGGAEKKGLSVDQLLECSNVLEPAISKAEAYQDEPAHA